MKITYTTDINLVPIAPFNIDDSARGHSFSTYAKYSKQLAFPTPWYDHVRVLSGGKKC